MMLNIKHTTSKAAICTNLHKIFHMYGLPETSGAVISMQFETYTFDQSIELKHSQTK